jgi:hypothetical protein
MSQATAQSNAFTDVVNDLMKELHPLPHSTPTIHHLVTNNFNSPVLAEIQQLSLSKLNTSQMATLLPALGQMTGLSSLALPECTPSSKSLKFLFTECPALSKLQSFDLRGVKELYSQDLSLLSQSTTLTTLTSLQLRGCSNIMRCRVAFRDSSGLIALFTSPVVQNLTHLSLCNDFIDDPEVCIALATSPHLTNLTSLDLNGDKITAKDATALAASTTLINLTDLKLTGSFLYDSSIIPLFSPPSLRAKKLQSLDLASARMTVSFLRVLLSASPHLTSLSLASNEKLGDAGAAFIAKSMPNLTKLDLTGCNIGDEGYAALTASTALTNLHELSLARNTAQAQSIAALVNSPITANLTHFDIGYSHKGPEVLTVIAQSQSMSKLQHLDFSSNEAGYEGILALSQSTTLTNLTWLSLSNNCIGPHGVKALCTSPVVSKLTHFDIGLNGGTGKSIAATLAAPSSTLYSIVELKARGIRMDDEDVLRLLATPNLDQLNVLDLTPDTIHATKKINESTKAMYWARF